jgi:hypothetical protein
MLGLSYFETNENDLLQLLGGCKSLRYLELDNITLLKGQWEDVLVFVREELLVLLRMELSSIWGGNEYQMVVFPGLEHATCLDEDKSSCEEDHDGFIPIVVRLGYLRLEEEDREAMIGMLGKVLGCMRLKDVYYPMLE